MNYFPKEFNNRVNFSMSKKVAKGGLTDAVCAERLRVYNLVIAAISRGEKTYTLTIRGNNDESFIILEEIYIRFFLGEITGLNKCEIRLQAEVL